MGLSPKLTPERNRHLPALSSSSSSSRSHFDFNETGGSSSSTIPIIRFTSDDSGDETTSSSSDSISSARKRALMRASEFEYAVLPSYSADFSPPMSVASSRSTSRRMSSNDVAGGRAVGSGIGISLANKVARPARLRWRTLALMSTITIFIMVMTPPSSRSAFHSALTSAGVPLPDRLVPDRLQYFLESWAVFKEDDGSDDLMYIPNELDEENDDRGLESMEDANIETPHEFHSNGHFLIRPPAMLVVPPSTHPIATLIKRAEYEWKKKVGRQSRTLQDAVKEYRRRYTRNPPKGFDQWWAYAQANRIVLTDEYDQIHRDLEPFWALEPSDLLHRADMMVIRKDTFTITIKDGKVSLVGEQALLRRAKDLGDLIVRFGAHVSDVNLTFTRHDQPAIQLGWYHKEKMLELARLGEYFGPSDWVNEGDPALSNWANGCPPNSSLRQVEVIASQEPPAVPGSGIRFKSHSPAYTTDLSRQRSFIYDHQSAMDICQHPEIMPIHGFTTSPGTTPGPLAALFTFAKTSIHSDILVTPLEQYSDTYVGYDPDFKKKSENRLLWRGSTTGANFDAESDWRSSQRSRLHFLTHEKHGVNNVLVEEGGEGEEKVVVERPMQMRKMNAKYMDVSFSGGPVQCDAATCNLMKKIIHFAPTMGLDESYQYKYVIDLDGNGWSGRFHRLMSMKALVLKSTIFPEWYSDRIQPWLHYVPVKVDYSDLYDIMTFFRGAVDGKDAHEDLAAKIGLAGKRWARDHWRKQDMAGTIE